MPKTYYVVNQSQEAAIFNQLHSKEGKHIRTQEITRRYQQTIYGILQRVSRTRNQQYLLLSLGDRDAQFAQCPSYIIFSALENFKPHLDCVYLDILRL